MADDSFYTELNAGGVATLTLNRPELHNAFDDRLIADLIQELRDLRADSRVQAVVLAAAGKSFSAGADLNWMRRLAEYSWEQNLADARALAELMCTLNQLPKPTIAKVQGPAYGGGVGLVACCDMAIAAETASFSLSEVKLGLIPAVISPYVVNAIGERQARRYFLTGERFSAREAYRIGLVHEVVAPEALDEAVAELLDALASSGPAAIVATKELIYEVSRGPLDAGLIDDTARRIANIRTSAEGREGLTAFLNKRKPAWCKD
jgi:methylglutaconyl-CoA hydratase